MITLPENGRWVQSNKSDRLGSISSSRNINLDVPGYVRLSHAVRAAINPTVDANFDSPMAIVRSEDYGYFVATDDMPFQVNADSILTVRPTEIATAGVPSTDLQSDVIFNSGLMIVTQDTDVDYYDPGANTWTDTNITLTATTGSQHPVRNFHALAAFAIADVNTVKLYSNPITATPTLLATLTIPADFYITSMCYFNQNLYIGTMNRYGGHAFMYVWNGFGSAAQSAFEVGSNIIFDLVVFQDSVVLFVGSGEILRFVSSGFEQLDVLPTHASDVVISDETNIDMYHNCMKASGDLLYINVSQDASLYKHLEQPDGIWVYDADLGFAYHRFALSGALVDIDTIDTTDVNTTTDIITVTTAPITGTEVLFDDGTGTNLDPLVMGTKYFVIKQSSTTIKLATTRANALAGTAIDLTVTGNNTQALVFVKNIDFGQTYGDRVMAVCPIERAATYPVHGTELLFGGETGARTPTTSEVLCTACPLTENRGYFITPWISSDQVEDVFENLTIKFSKFKSELDKIVVKYRYHDDRRTDIALNAPTRWRGTWTSTTTFTTTETECSSAEVGDEIEIVQGGGSGMCAHISTISESSGTYTITIDETYDYYESGDLNRFAFRNFKKLGVISPTTYTNGVLDNERGYKKWALGNTVNGKQIQLKIELRGVATSIEEILINDKTYTPG